MADIPFVGEADVPTLLEDYQKAVEALRETTRQRDRLLARSRELQNRANLVAGMAQHDPDLQGQFRAAVFILTGSWPGGETD